MSLFKVMLLISRDENLKIMNQDYFNNNPNTTFMLGVHYYEFKIFTALKVFCF